MKRTFFALLFFAAAFAVAANAQRFGNSTCGLIPGPCMERYARQAYAPVDYMINNFGYGNPYGGYGDYGYYGNGRFGTNIAVSAVAGLAGGLVANAIHNREREYVGRAPDGGRYYYGPAQEPAARPVVFAASKPQKPLDCRKPAGKRGRNEAACAAAEQEIEAAKEEAKHQACLADLNASHWRIRNFSPVAVMYVTLNNQPMVVCGGPVSLEPLQTIRIFPPDGQVGGYFFFAHSSGEKMRAKAQVQNVNRPGFVGFVLAVPGPLKGGN